MPTSIFFHDLTRSLVCSDPKPQLLKSVTKNFQEANPVMHFLEILDIEFFSPLEFKCLLTFKKQMVYNTKLPCCLANLPSYNPLAQRQTERKRQNVSDSVPLLPYYPTHQPHSTVLGLKLSSDGNQLYTHTHRKSRYNGEKFRGTLPE